MTQTRRLAAILASDVAAVFAAHGVEAEATPERLTAATYGGDCAPRLRTDPDSAAGMEDDRQDPVYQRGDER